jgi:hypothetical protein
MPRQKRKTRPSRGIYHSVELLEGDGGVVEPFLPNEEERTAEVMSNSTTTWIPRLFILLSFLIFKQNSNGLDQRNLKSRLPYYVFFSIYICGDFVRSRLQVFGSPWMVRSSPYQSSHHPRLHLSRTHATLPPNRHRHAGFVHSHRPMSPTSRYRKKFACVKNYTYERTHCDRIPLTWVSHPNHHLNFQTRRPVQLAGSNRPRGSPPDELMSQVQSSCTRSLPRIQRYHRYDKSNYCDKGVICLDAVLGIPSHGMGANCWRGCGELGRCSGGGE